MDREALLFRISDRLGLDSRGEAAAAARAVCAALGRGLSRVVAHTVGADLPEELALALMEGPHAGRVTLGSLQEEVARQLGASRSQAVEEAEVVCGALAESLRPEMVRLLRGDLRGPVGSLLTPPEVAEAARHVHLDPSAHTLAEGRPGSSRPLSGARLDRAQTESVVRSSNPHGDTKLSSATGLTQEREHETLAEGTPGSSRPLSTARPRGSR